MQRTENVSTFLISFLKFAFTNGIGVSMILGPDSARQVQIVNTVVGELGFGY
jgi:hypothetical protein